MTVTTNTTDRKALAKALADKLGTTAKYMGPPTFGYQVGDYIVDRDGNIEGEDFEALRDFLQSIGCFPEEETDEYQTLAGFVLYRLGHIPVAGEYFLWRGLRFEVVDMDGSRIDKLLVELED